jgi:CelD/BcsL family acetyltransferase involved in cellulose biosynthesis
MTRTGFTDAGFSLLPLAEHTGPFPMRPFLETWWDHLGAGDELAIVSTDEGTLPLRVHEGRVLFCGDAGLTDYHSPLGDAASGLAAAAGAHSGYPFSFDSLPAEAASAIADALEAGRHAHTTVDDGLTMVIDLSGGVDGWLADLRKKDRHELRRKRRNFTGALGEPRLERHDSDEAVALFADLHRSADGAKASFMVPAHEAFFADLVRRAGATVELLLAGAGVAAAAFGFAGADGYYLYNSAYDPAVAEFSPGIVLLTTVIERLTHDGVERLDLLKGDEAYKFRLGGKPRQLHRIEGTFA